MNNIWELIINIIEALLFCLLLNQKLERKDINHLYCKQFTILFIQSILLYIMNQLNISPLLVILGFTVLHYVFAHIFFLSANIIKLFWVIVYTIASLTADAITTIIPTHLLNYNIESLLAGGTLRLPFTLLYIALLTIMILILLCFTTKTFRLTKSEKITFILLSVICISIEELIILEQVNITNGTSNLNLIYSIFFLVMILFITLVFYVYNLGIEKEKNVKMAELHMASEMEKKQYSQIIQSISELRIMKHDLSNHLKAIQTMLALEHFTDADKYISSLIGTIDQSYFTISSGNTPVDCIVTNKLKQSQAASISVDYTIHLPNKIPLSDIETCSLIGNLFDNAIESCNKLETDNKNIQFIMKPYNSMLSIQIKNSSIGDYITNSNRSLLTTKITKDKTTHGIGLNRIHDIVEKHQGFLEITPEKHYFQISILIPLEPINNETNLTLNGDEHNEYTNCNS